MTPSSHPAPTPRSPIDRFSDLANHNRLVAIATVLTIITGIAFLIGTFSRDDHITKAILFEALEAARARVTTASEDSRPIFTADGGSIEAPSAELQTAALNALHAAAETEGATEDERKRIVKALIDHSMGDPKAALRELERVALAQEARGASADAAGTWRHRSILMRFSDTALAIEDAERADELAQGSTQELLDLAMLHTTAGNMDNTVLVSRRAAAQAASEQDDLRQAWALQNIGGVGYLTSWAADQTFERERFAAITDSLKLLTGLLTEDPGDEEVIRYYLGSVMMGILWKLDSDEWREATREASEVLAVTRDFHLAAESREGFTLATEYAIAVCYTGEAAIQRMQDAPPEETKRLLMEALARVEDLMASPLRDSVLTATTSDLAFLIAELLHEVEATTEAIRGFRLSIQCTDELAADGRSSPSHILTGGLVRLRVAMMMQLTGDTKAAAEYIRDGVKISESSIPLVPDPLVRLERKMVLYVFASGGWPPTVEHADSLHYAEAAIRHYEDRIVGTRREESLIPGYQAMLTWREELTSAPSEPVAD